MATIRGGLIGAMLAAVLITVSGCSSQTQTGAGAKASSATPAASSGVSSPAPASTAPHSSAPASPKPVPTSSKTAAEASGKGSAVPANTGSTDNSTVGTSKPDPAVQLGKVTAVRLIDPTSGWTGGKGWIARTDDSGKTWTVQYQGEQTVKQLFALNSKEAWAVLQAGSGDKNGDRLLKTTDGGKHWTAVGRMPNNAFLHFDSVHEAFAGNAYSSDGGKTWTNRPVPFGTQGNAYFHDKLHGWAAVNIDNGNGSQKQRKIAIERTDDGGKTWTTVMTRTTYETITRAVVRSAGIDDAWVECIGDLGMSQESFSLFHTEDAGKTWIPVLVDNTAGAGPAPGYPMNEETVDKYKGHFLNAYPGQLDVVSPQVAFMGGFCPACDKANSIGWTTDGGKTWTNSKENYPGFAGGFVAMADAKKGWWICTSPSNPSVMYTTADGGLHWKLAHTFDKPKSS